MTGLALLTFLAHGETPASERYGETVQKAIQYLVSVQREDGSFQPSEVDQGAGRGGVYAHGIATYALCEAYALTRIPMVRDAMVKAVTLIIKGQRPDGGFDYNFERDGGARDRCTSVAGWQAQALKAAQLSGVRIPGLNEAADLAAAGFKLQYNPQQAHFIYSSQRGDRDIRHSMTPIGALCLQLLGHSRSREVRGALGTLSSWEPSWSDPNMGGGILEPVYVWYYTTQVFFHEGGRIWERWNDLFAPMLIDNQNENGSWTFDHGRSAAYGPVYFTTLSALMLTVYYRYLPTFQVIPQDEISTELGDEEDLQIEII